ncbi:uncharacterized protein METZ01_LOCUS435939, partial [marine metagenome]
NLEGVPSHINPNPFIFAPDCTFPFPDNSVKTVYSSHALEHMNQPTVDRVLEESYRILKHGGHLVLKLPDFDRVLECWRQEDADFFDDNWGYSQIINTWDNYNVSDTIDSRAAFIFCGFWNDAYGDHFKQIWSGSMPGVVTIQEQNRSKAFHGPPAVSKDVYKAFKNNYSPKQISEKLCQIVMSTETNYHFNHQNAWSRHELKELVTRFNFVVLAQDTEVVLKNCWDLPQIRQMLSLSMYLLAKKTRIIWGHRDIM